MERPWPVDVETSRTGEQIELERMMADRRTLGLMGVMLGLVTLCVTMTAFMTVRHHMDDVRSAEQATMSILDVPSIPAAFTVAAR
jgi:hypothetical protein